MTVHASGFQDGLGERRNSTGTANQPLELLILPEEFGAVPGFEAALRERVDALSTFRHAAFARVHAVGKVAKSQSRLVVASERATGTRLSEVLATAEQRLIPLVFDAALGVLDQLLRALAAMHEAAPSAAHGALGPERLILAADGRLVVADYACGAALEQLRFSRERYWKELRIPLPQAAGLPHFDRRADVTQVGAIALALMLGRPLGDDEVPARVADIVDSVRAISASGLDVLPAGMRSWLGRTLQLDVRSSFATAIEAAAEFQAASGYDEQRSREALMAFLEQYQRVIGTTQTRASTTTGAVIRAERGPLAASRDEQAAPASKDERRDIPAPAPAAAAAPSPPMPAAAHLPASATPAVAALTPAKPVEVSTGKTERLGRVFQSVDDPDESDADAADEAGELDEAAPRGPWRSRVAAAAAILIAITTAGAFAARNYVRGPAMGTLIVNTNPSGVEASVDGERRGSTPLTIEVTAGEHVLELRAAGQVRTIPLTVAEGAQVAQFIELPKSEPVDGQLHVRTDPPGAIVTVDGERRGESPLVVGGLAPGAHSVVLDNELGSVREQVTIEAGVTATLVVPMTAPQGAPVSGWIAVTAPLEMQVLENGTLLGTSRTDRIMMPVGRHQLQIGNETLAFSVTRTVQVAPGKVTAVRIDLPRGSMALNATPWAEVWVDGERIGETPIGNVQVPIGPHDVLFRHPELGEQRHTVMVTATAPARISADLRRR
jgi:hypothetical protein